MPLSEEQTTRLTELFLPFQFDRASYQQLFVDNVFESVIECYPLDFDYLYAQLAIVCQGDEAKENAVRNGDGISNIIKVIAKIARILPHYPDDYDHIMDGLYKLQIYSIGAGCFQNFLLDWPDEACARILSEIGKDSRFPKKPRGNITSQRIQIGSQIGDYDQTLVQEWRRKGMLAAAPLGACSYEIYIENVNDIYRKPEDLNPDRYAGQHVVTFDFHANLNRLLIILQEFGVLVLTREQAAILSRIYCGSNRLTFENYELFKRTLPPKDSPAWNQLIDLLLGGDGFCDRGNCDALTIEVLACLDNFSVLYSNHDKWLIQVMTCDDSMTLREAYNLFVHNGGGQANSLDKLICFIESIQDPAARKVFELEIKQKFKRVYIDRMKLLDMHISVGADGVPTITFYSHAPIDLLILAKIISEVYDPTFDLAAPGYDPLTFMNNLLQDKGLDYFIAMVNHINQYFIDNIKKISGYGNDDLNSNPYVSGFTLCAWNRGFRDRRQTLMIGGQLYPLNLCFGHEGASYTRVEREKKYKVGYYVTDTALGQPECPKGNIFLYAHPTHLNFLHRYRSVKNQLLEYVSGLAAEQLRGFFVQHKHIVVQVWDFFLHALIYHQSIELCESRKGLALPDYWNALKPEERNSFLQTEAVARIFSEPAFYTPAVLAEIKMTEWFDASPPVAVTGVSAESLADGASGSSVPRFPPELPVPSEVPADGANGSGMPPLPPELPSSSTVSVGEASGAGVQPLPAAVSSSIFVLPPPSSSIAGPVIKKEYQKGAVTLTETYKETHGITSLVLILPSVLARAFKKKVRHLELAFRSKAEAEIFAENVLLPLAIGKAEGKRFFPKPVIDNTIWLFVNNDKAGATQWRHSRGRLVIAPQATREHHVFMQHLHKKGAIETLDLDEGIDSQIASEMHAGASSSRPAHQ